MIAAIPLLITGNSAPRTPYEPRKIMAKGTPYLLPAAPFITITNAINNALIIIASMMLNVESQE
jgi:hypothetical protein